LADTTYGSCCVDEIAAAHVDADSVIHFGNACRSKASRLPVLYLYPELPLEVPAMLKQLGTLQPECGEREVCIYFDIGYQHLYEQQEQQEPTEGEDTLYSQIREVLCPKKLHIEVYPPPAEDCAETKTAENASSVERICVFVGADNQRFANLSLTTTALQWYILDGATATLSMKNPLTAQYIRKRYYYIEKCKDAQTLGLIVATLSAVGYLDVVTRGKPIYCR